MTALDHRTPEASIDAAFSRAADVFRGFLRALVNRRQLGRLGDMSDSGLADIGLMRGDLHFARRQPLGVDPTARLAIVARERVHTLRRFHDR